MHAPSKQGFTLMFICLCCSALPLMAQQAFIRLVSPQQNKVQVRTARQFITGVTCKDCKLTVNDVSQRVWPTGAFAVEVNLRQGDTSFRLQAVDARGNTSTASVFFSFQPLPRETAVTSNSIAYWRIEPQGDLLLQPGEALQMTLKTLPGSVVKLDNGTSFTELPVQDSQSVRGIYQLHVPVTGSEWINGQPRQLKASVTTPAGDLIEATSKFRYGIMEQPLLLRTRGAMPYLLTGLGEDRLGGTKIGYLDSMVVLKSIGKTGDKYCVQLSKYRRAYIEEQHVELLGEGPFSTQSITGSMRVWGDSSYDYVSLQLPGRLPYQSFQELQPSRIILDVFGATANTNWITQLQSARGIRHVSYQQLQDEVVRVQVELNHQQHWGHRVYYAGNNLVLRIRRPPAVLNLSSLVIAVDAGHGGTNKGAFGIAGTMEKDMTLLVAAELQRQLEAAGAKVSMTRTKDTSFDNHDRYKMWREREPHLLVSIHLNSSADPVRIKGTSTYYKHIGYRGLSQAILRQLLGMGLTEFGLVGNFNFILNGFTEFPNVLVETLFVSHPEDETNILDPAYRSQLAARIVAGIQDWLALQQSGH